MPKFYFDWECALTSVCLFQLEEFLRHCSERSAEEYNDDETYSNEMKAVLEVSLDLQVYHDLLSIVLTAWIFAEIGAFSLPLGTVSLCDGLDW
jgi:hypothetical protein